MISSLQLVSIAPLLQVSQPRAQGSGNVGLMDVMTPDQAGLMNLFIPTDTLR